MQFGSMPHELAERNIRLVGSEVLPHLRDVWDAEGWENRWWPAGGCTAEPGGRRRMSVSVETVAVRHCEFEAKVKVAGTRPAGRLPASRGRTGLGPVPRRARRAATRSTRPTIRAPAIPSATRSTACPSLWDLVLFYDELLDALGLERVPLVGASFGGMVACEVAAHRRRAISALVLLDPIGLWRDDAPVAQYMTMLPDELAAVLFHDPRGEAAQAALALPVGRR